MLVEMALFDAYGAGFEFVEPPVIKAHNHLRAYLRHPKWNGAPGRYTDDTQMALALAELLLRKPVKAWTHYDVARAFVATFKRDPRTGYSGMFFDLLKQIETGWDFLKMVVPHSDKNGGSMRAPVIGILPHPSQVEQVARFQASLTHCTTAGMDAAAASALTLHYFYYRIGPKAELPSWLESKAIGYISKPHRGYVSTYGTDAVQAAVTAIVDHDTLGDVLRACVACGGDVDTVAAIAGAAASFSDEIDQTLPAVLVDRLENGKFGRDYLAGMDAKLLAKFPRPEDYEDEDKVETNLWCCTDCGHEVTFTPHAEPASDEILDCPDCGGYKCLSLVGALEEPDDLITDLFSS